MNEPRTQLDAALDEIACETLVLLESHWRWAARVGSAPDFDVTRAAAEIVRLTANGQGYLRLMQGNKKATPGRPRAA